MLEEPAQEPIPELAQSQPTLVALVVEGVLLVLSADGQVEMRPGARPVRERLGHEGRDGTVFLGDLARGHLEQDHVVGGLQRIGVGEVDFELAVRVLVVDLVHVDTDSTQMARQIVEDAADARQSLVVVAGLVRGVRRIERRELPVRRPLQQHELRLDAGKQGVAALGEALQLILERDTRVKGIRLTVDVTVARNPGKPGHPWQVADCGGVADTHEVGPVRAYSQSPHRESREAGAIADHHVVVLDRHRFRLGSPVDVHELRQQVAGLVLSEEFPGLVRCHVLLPMTIAPTPRPTSSSVVQK